MSLLKSPLLLLGIAIIMLAGGALFAPYFIDWGNYRADFEKYGRQLTGRETKVLGDISVKLFPWPAMKIKDVRIANPPGATVKELFRADEIDVRLRLAPLLSGKLEVEAIEINRPVIAIERLASGKGSWLLQPQAGAIKLFGADDVAVSGISITNGTVVLADGQRGGQAQLDGFNAFISARSLNGPWKLRGEAVINDQGIDIVLNTGKWREGQALKFGLRLSPVDQAGLTYSFDGQSSAGQSSGAQQQKISGKLKIVPTASKKGKSDMPADFRPMVFRSEVEADFDGIRFSKIEVAPKDAVDVQTFLTGNATVKLGSILQIDTTLKAARFDADSILGNRGRKTLRSINSLDAIARLVASLPENVRLRAVIDLTTLVLAGQSLDGARIDLDVAESTLRINQLSVALPGQTRATFKGGLLAGDKQPQLIGDLTLDVISLKDFSKWAAGSYRREIEEKWSGARGRFKLAAKIDLSRQNFRLQDGVFSLDGANGTLAMSFASGTDPAASVHLESNVLDIDRYAPEGLVSKVVRDDLSGLIIDGLTMLVGERDLNLLVKTGRLVMNTVEARDVALEFNASENGVEFRQFKLGSVGGAFVDLSGLVEFTDDNITGSVKGTVNADDPAKLVKLVSGKKPSQIWLKSVSPLKMNITGQAVAKDKQTTGKLALKGSAGNSEISGNGQFTGTVSEWRKANLFLSGQLSGKSARQLLAIFSIGVDKGKDGVGKIAFTASGNLQDGLATTADFEAFGVNAQFSGLVDDSRGGPKARGRVAVLVENTDQIFGVLGVDPGDTSPIGKVFSSEGVLEASGRVFDLKDLRGTAAGTSFKGRLNLNFESLNPTVKLDLETGRLSLPFIIGVAMLEHNGKRQTPETRFSPQAMAGVTAAIKIKTGKLAFWPGFDVKNATLSLDARQGAIKLAAAGKRQSGQQVALVFDANVGEQLTRVSAKFNGAIKLEELLKTSASDPVITGYLKIGGEFGGSGRTPGGLLAALSGRGDYEISDGVVKNISPVQFSQNLAIAETAQDVEKVITNSLRVGSMKFGDGNGQIELENGVARFVPLVIKGPGARGLLDVTYEMPSGLVDIAVRLKLDEPANVPGFEIAYAGLPDELAPSSNFSNLKSYLTVAALNRTLDKLEALEEEQRRLVEEEQKVRAEAEAKRKAQQEKQRLLREKQRKLLEDATRTKAREAEKKNKTIPRKKAEPVPPLVAIPKPRPLVPKPTVPKPLVTKPLVPNSGAPKSVQAPIRVPVPVPVPGPTTRATVIPQVQVEELPPLILTNPRGPKRLFPRAKTPKKPPRPVINWRSGKEIEGGR